MPLLRPALPPRRLQAFAAGALLGLVCLWFWLVAAHRIDDAPYPGFASVFVTGCGDFEHFYQAAWAMREGRDIYSAGVHGYIYPPLIAFAFIPLTLLPVKSAALLMLVVNLALALACAWLAAAEFMRRFEMELSFERVIVVAAVTLLLAAPKLRSELQMWQTNVPMLFALLLALRWLDARPRWAGVLLGLAVNIKYLPLVYLPYLLLRRRFRAAAWFGAGIVGVALLPALVTGWSANLNHWATALSGIARLLGLGSLATEVANVDPITIGHSISITSGIARALASGHVLALPAAGALVVGAMLLLACVYRRAGVPALRWPSANAQVSQPYLGTLALEWGALLALALAFSPQTNPRHTCLLLMVFAPLAAMLCAPRPAASRWPALAASAILFCGLVLPPNTPQFASELARWRELGGAGWCMLAMLPFFVWAGLRHLDARRAVIVPRRDCVPAAGLSFDSA